MKKIILSLSLLVTLRSGQYSEFLQKRSKVHSNFIIQHLYGEGNDFVTEESNYELFDLNHNKLDEGKVIVIWKKTAGFFFSGLHFS